MRRQATKTKDTIGLQEGHQDTNNEGHNEDTKTKDAIGLQGHQDTNNEGHHDTSGHEPEGRHWTSGHKQPRTP